MNCLDCKSALVFRMPKKTYRAGAVVLRLVCPACGSKFLASDEPHSHPYRTHKKRDASTVKEVRTVRLSDRDMESIEAGRMRLVIVNQRITLAV